MIHLHRTLLAAGFAVFLPSLPSLGADANYDEAKVPNYTLPDPLVTTDGRDVTSAAMWREERRAEVLELFEEHVYGRTPDVRTQLVLDVTESPGAVGGKAIAIFNVQNMDKAVRVLESKRSAGRDTRVQLRNRQRVKVGNRR